MPIDLLAQAQSSESTQPTDAAPSAPVDLLAGKMPTSTPSKALALAGSAAAGTLEGAGAVVKGLPNIGMSIVQKGLDYLNKEGIVPDSVAKGFSKGRSAFNETMDAAGKKIMDFQKEPAAADVAANPTIAKVGNIAGQALGGTLASGGMLPAARGLSAVNAGVLQQGVSGALMGAGQDAQNPLGGAALGAGIGTVVGGVAGRFSRKASIINDKIDEAAKAGYGPMSQQGQASIKKALEDGGQDLSKEELEQQTKNVLTQKLESIASPKLDLNKSPTEQIADLAKANFKEVKATKNALYQPLNESVAEAATPTLTSTLGSELNATTQKMLPKTLPENPTISDLMAYRRSVAAKIDQANKAAKAGVNTEAYDTVGELAQIKTAVTKDLEDSAAKVGLDGQLAKADTYHKNNYLPFQIYNKAGQLTSDRDGAKAMTIINKALITPRPNFDKLNEVAKTLGPQGKELMAHAYLQQSVKNAVDLDGKIDVAMLRTKFNRLENSGLGDLILTPETREAFDGMKLVVDGANKTVKGMDKPTKDGVMSLVDGLTHSAGGIAMLRAIGSKTAPAAKIKNFVLQLLSSGLIKNQTTPEQKP